MQQAVGESGRGFKRMAECVAKIEQRALTAFALIPHHGAGFGAATYGDGMFARRPARKHIA